MYYQDIKWKKVNYKLKSGLQFLLVSEMRIFHTLTLKFKNQLFGVIVTRHFRPERSGHLNESVYCKPIYRTLKMFFIDGSDSFLQPIIPELWKLLVFVQKNKNIRRLKILTSKNKSFHNLHKVSKSTVLNTIAVDL